MTSTLSYTTESFLTDGELKNWRRTGVYSSDVASIAGEVLDPSRTQVWIEKVGKSRPRNTTERMRWRSRLNDDIAEEYVLKTGLEITGKQLHVRSGVNPWQIATLNAIAEDERIVEFVTIGYEEFGPLIQDDIHSLPRTLILRVHHQMAVTGASRADVAVFTPSLELWIYHLPRHDGLVDALTHLEQEFWWHVQSKVAPPSNQIGDAENLLLYTGVNETTIDLDMDSQEAVDVYEESCVEITVLEQTRDLAKEHFLRSMGSARRGRLPNGRVVTLSVIDSKKSGSSASGALISLSSPLLPL